MYYFIGIKGSGMASLACILKDCGYEVCGSDIDKEIFIQKNLIEKNIPFYSFNKNNIKDGMNVIIGNAFDETHEEVKAALENPTVTTLRRNGRFFEYKGLPGSRFFNSGQSSPIISL